MFGIIALLALVALNGFFVAAEFSMVRVRPARLQRLAKRNVPGAATAARVASEIDRYLSISQIGITLCSLALGWVGEAALASLVERLWFAIRGQPLGPTAHGIGTGITFALLTYMHVLLGEQVPKMIALHRAESVALALAPPFRIFFVLLGPVSVVLEGATRGFLWMLGLRGDLPSEGELSVEELTSVIAATMARGPRAEDKRELLERVVRFASRQARHAMVPRVDVAFLPIGTRGSEAISFLRAQEYSRTVLTENQDLDRTVGYLYAKDLLLDPKANSLPDLSSVRRDVLFVPESQSLIDVLRAMQQSQTLFAIVVDEYGGTAGILTMEDLLEEIVGEIRDEADTAELPRIQPVEKLNGVYDVEPHVALEELRSLGLELGEEDGMQSLGSFVVKQLGRLPRRGDRVPVGSFDAEIRGVRRRRVVRLRLWPRAISEQLSVIAPSPSRSDGPDLDGEPGDRMTFPPS